jgi:arylsulfatase A-like enzyme
MADDLDQRSMDILLDNGLMPNLQSLVIDPGVTFSESFATYPLCCPSRATFLTGQYAHNHNVMNNALPLGGVSKLDDSSTIATWLDDAGYHTAYVGKYLNRYGQDTAETYIPPGWDDWQATVGGSAYRMYQYTVNDNGVLVKYGAQEKDYQTDVLAGRAVQVIEEADAFDSTPYFLYINPLAPHVDGQTTSCELNYGSLKTIRPAQRHIGASAVIDFPQVPSFNEADMNDKPFKYRYPQLDSAQIQCLDDLFHDRLDSMLAVDDMIGDVVDALKATKDLWRTIIVFTDDNGFMLGEHRLHGKQYAYEESIRLPLYMRIPGVSAKSIDKLVINNDLAPTFLEFARAKAEAGFEIDGRSLVPLIYNPTIQWRNGFLIEDNLYSAVRTEDYVYVFHYSGAKELYDLNNDPYQLQNVRNTSPWKSKLTALDEWRTALDACEGDNCRLLEDRTPP